MLLCLHWQSIKKRIIKVRFHEIDRLVEEVDEYYNKMFIKSTKNKHSELAIIYFYKNRVSLDKSIRNNLKLT